MSTVYYRYNSEYEVPAYPGWSTWWIGKDGCSSRNVYQASRAKVGNPSAGSPKYYDPETVTFTLTSPKVSGRRQGIPPFGFTDYRKGRVSVKQHLIRINWAQNGIALWQQYGDVHKVAGNCTPYEFSRVNLGAQYSTYYELTRDQYITYPSYSRSYISEGTVQAEADALRNELLADAASSYDILTDIAEIRDIPRTITSISKDVLNIYRGLVGRHGYDVIRGAAHLSPMSLLKHPNKLFRKLGDEWLQYRYGIMTLVYSYRDCVKTLNRGASTRTRKMRVVTPVMTGQEMPADTSIYRISDVTGSITIRGEVFQHFSVNEIARLSGMGINPLVTAWELIPYSFVADWFVDVGNYIAAATSQTWAQTRYACISRREQLSKNTWVHLPNGDKTYTITNVLPVNWWGAAPPGAPNVVIKNAAGEYILDQEISDVYTRQVIPFTAVAPTFNPSLNWRRLLDGAFLSLNQLERFIRRFR